MVTTPPTPPDPATSGVAAFQGHCRATLPAPEFMTHTHACCRTRHPGHHLCRCGELWADTASVTSSGRNPYTSKETPRGAR